MFIRPEVTTHTSMAVQSAENAALQSGTFVISSNQVTKGAYGGYVTISEQDLDWTDPAVLSLILDDMARIYANTTDDVAADALLAGCSQSAVLTDPTSAAEWVRKYPVQLVAYSARTASAVAARLAPAGCGRAG